MGRRPSAGRAEGVVALSAPVEIPVEQVTQPLAVPVPPQGCRSEEAGVWLVPATVVAAVACGAVIRAYFDTDGRLLVAGVLLAGLLAGLLGLACAAGLLSRVIDR